MKKYEFKKELKELYTARRSIEEIDAGTGIYLSVKGKGSPGGEEFSESVQAVFSVAYTLKFGLKHQGIVDFTVSGLETLYLDDPEETPMEEWRWQMLVRIPEEITPEHIQAAVAEIKIKKGLEVSGVERIELREGRSLQALHIGPYNEVGKTYENLKAYIQEKELAVSGAPHEIYMNDPRRTAPERLKTIVRVPIE